MSTVENSEKFVSQILDTSLWRPFVNQINKDFQMVGVNFTSISTQISAKQFLCHLRDSIAHLINHDFDKLLNLLYRIDISETHWNTKDTIHQNDLVMKIVSLIIVKEYQKVSFRNKN